MWEGFSLLDVEAVQREQRIETDDTICTITRTNHFVEVADVDAMSTLVLLPRLHLHQVVSKMHLFKKIESHYTDKLS